jgi:hypothetical protein
VRGYSVGVAEFSYYALLVCTALIGFVGLGWAVVILVRQLTLSARMRRSVADGQSEAEKD